MNMYGFADEASKYVDEQIIAMKKNGLKGLEIRSVDGENISDISLEKAKEVKEKMEAAGLVTWSIGSPLGKIDIEEGDFAKELEKCKHTIEIAHALDCNNIRMFSFYIKEEKCYDEYRNEVIDRLGRMVEVSKNTGILLCHENEKGIFGDNAARCADILTSVPELKGIFDPANFVQCGQDTWEAWELLKKHIYYMHVKDALANGSVVPAGKGIGNIEKIIAEFVKMGGKDFTMEPHLAIFEGLKELEREGEESVVGKEFVYANEKEAFDAACDAFKIICNKL
ncbi:MAG: TIM barrel protein [Eubacteriales bacterium]